MSTSEGCSPMSNVQHQIAKEHTTSNGDATHNIQLVDNDITIDDEDALNDVHPLDSDPETTSEEEHDDQDAVDSLDARDSTGVADAPRQTWVKEYGHPFVIISILGPPSSGKSTICRHLVKKYNFCHERVRVRVGLRAHINPEHPLSRHLLDKLENDEYIDGETLQPYVQDAIEQSHDRHERGVVFDDYPRRMEQISNGFNMWNFENDHPWLFIRDEERYVPDLVIYLDVDSETALARQEKLEREEFERDFADSVHETMSILDTYRDQGVLVEINAVLTMGEVVAEVHRALQKSGVLTDTANGH